MQSAIGFGFSLMAAPLLFAAVRPTPAVGLLLVLGAEVNLLTLGSERRTPRPLARDSAVMLACSAPGALAGVALLRSLSPVALQVGVTLGVIATLAARHLGGSRAHVPAWAAGLGAGALTTSTSTSGPPLLLHLLGRGISPEQVRDTLTCCFLGLGALGAIALATTGNLALPRTWLVLALVPAVAAAHLVGRRLFARLAAGGSYEVVLNVALGVAVVAGLVGVLV
jgi:uncharacterized protein